MILCQYCMIPTKLVTGKEIHPHREYLHKRYYWRCPVCKAYVGCHKNTIQPLGNVANYELRKYRVKAHKAFDPLWKSGKNKYFRSRTKAYKWLANKLNISIYDCHIGRMSINTCKKVIMICKDMYRD